MTHPTLEQYIEGEIERFDGEFPSPDGHDFIGMERISGLKSFLKSSIQGAWEKRDNEWREKIEKDLFSIQYLCPFCVNRQDADGECTCDCHFSEHIIEYRKQINERLVDLLEQMEVQK